VTRHTQRRTRARTPVVNGSNVVRILRRNCLPKHVIGGKIGETRRRRRIRKQPLGNNKREETVNRKKHFDHTLWRTDFCRRLWTYYKRDYVFGIETAVSPCKNKGHWGDSTHKNVVYSAEGDFFFVNVRFLLLTRLTNKFVHASSMV
jgi:hypothetical protein